MKKGETLPLYKIEISYSPNKNRLMFIPSFYVSVAKGAFYVLIRWFFIEICVHSCTDLRKTRKYISFFLLPYFYISKVPKDYKEKWDFQFHWLWIAYRKFFGTKEKYYMSLKEAGFEIKKYSFIRK